MPPPTMLATIPIIAQVIVIALLFAHETVTVTRALAAGLAREARRRAVLAGIGAALAMRMLLALAAARLLGLIGATLTGWLLLLWAGWALVRQMGGKGGPTRRGFTRAVGAALLANTALGLDVALGVAAAARGQRWVLGFGLAAAVALPAILAVLRNHALLRWRWPWWIGFGTVVWLGASLLWSGLRG